MPTLVIPEQYQPGFEVLLALTDDDFVVLTKALNEIPATVRLKKDIVSAVTPTLPSLQAQQHEDLVATVYSLYQILAQAEVGEDRFVRDLLSAMAKTGRTELRLQGEARNRFFGNMVKLLNVKSLKFLAKAHALQRDHEHIFHSGKILTDLRPVFSAAENEPEGMIVEHTLKIVFHDGFRHKEMFMALDSEDLANLRNAIERAETKAKSLSALLDAKNVKQLSFS